MGSLLNRHPLTYWWMVVSAVLVCVGSVGPWERAFDMTLNGLSAGGLPTLVLGVAAVVLLAVHARPASRRRQTWALGVLLWLGVAIGPSARYHWWEAGRFADEVDVDLLEDFLGGEGPSVAWGLVLVTLAGASLAVATLAALLQHATEPETITGATIADASTAGAHDLDPRTGARLAGYGRRAAAGVVDFFVVVTTWVAAFAWAYTTEDPVTEEISDMAAIVILVVLLGVGPLYQWLTIGRWGKTLGKKALGVKVVRADDALPVSYGQALGRALSFELLWLFTLPGLLAILWPLWDDRRQTLYDKMAGTIVVRSGRESQAAVVAAPAG